jgi:predicted amidophosphoribosyltransferase
MVSNKDIKNYSLDNKRICQFCSKKNSMTAEFCIECGKKLPKFEIPFINKSLSAEDLIKDKNEKSISNSVNFERTPIEMPEKKEIIKNEKELDNVDDFIQNNIKNLDTNSNENICPNCGNINPDNAKFCIKCGKALHKSITQKIGSKPKANKMPLNNKNINSNPLNIQKNNESYPDLNTQKCQTCGNTNKSCAKFCVICGKSLKNTTKPNIESNPQENNKSLNNKEDIASNPLDIQKKSVELIKDGNLSSEVNSEIDPLDAIKKANELLQIGAITEEEFETIKTKYIKKI